MAKTPRNSGKEWSRGDDALLRRLAKGNTPTRITALKLERTPGAVYQRASQLEVSLKPTNQRPNKGQKGQ